MAVLRPLLVLFFANQMNIFHKTEVQTIILRDIHVVGKKITRSGLKMAIYHPQILGNTLYLSGDMLMKWA